MNRFQASCSRAEDTFARALPVIALLTSEALQVIDVGSRAHHHLERRDDLAAGRAVTGISKEPVDGKRRRDRLSESPSSPLYLLSSGRYTSEFAIRSRNDRDRAEYRKLRLSP